MASRTEIRPAKDWSEVEQTARCAGCAFPDESFEFFRDRTIDVPELPLENTLVYIVDGELVSSLQIYERTLFFGDRRVRAGGIANVMTLPEHRGNGYASTLLQYAQQFVSERGYSLSLLIGDPGFYSRFGWQPLSFPRSSVDAPVTLPGEVDGEWVSYHATNLDRLEAIHGESINGIDGKVDRSVELWRDWVFTQHIDPEDVLLYDEDGEVRGYLVRERSNGTVVCHELGHVGRDNRAFQIACWNRLASGAERVVWNPPLGVLADPISAAGLDVSIDSVASFDGERPMIRLHAPISVGEGTIGATSALVDHVTGPNWYWSPLDKF